VRRSPALPPFFWSLTMPTVDDRIAALEAKLKQAKELKRKADARARTAASKQERRKDTRRKILAGSMLLQLVEDGEWPEEKLRARLDTYLVRDDDRALFELPTRDDPSRAERDVG